METKLVNNANFLFRKKKQVELELLHNRFELLFFVFEKEED